MYFVCTSFSRESVYQRERGKDPGQAVSLTIVLVTRIPASGS
jgi:hypothetical protein